MTDTPEQLARRVLDGTLQSVSKFPLAILAQAVIDLTRELDEARTISRSSMSATTSFTISNRER